MSSRLSRRKLAIYVAKQLIAGDELIIDQVASLLIADRREREADLLVKDIEDQLADLGLTVVTVETAGEIDEATQDKIKELFPDSEVVIRRIINPELIGGCRISTPSQLMDQTVAKRLSDLRTMKV